MESTPPHQEYDFQVKSYKEEKKRQIILEAEAHDFQSLGDVVLHRFWRDAEPCGNVRVGKSLEAAEDENGFRLVAEFGDGAVDDVLNLCGIEEFGVAGLRGRDEKTVVALLNLSHVVLMPEAGLLCAEMFKSFVADDSEKIYLRLCDMFPTSQFVPENGECLGRNILCHSPVVHESVREGDAPRIEILEIGYETFQFFRHDRLLLCIRQR